MLNTSKTSMNSSVSGNEKKPPKLDDNELFYSLYDQRQWLKNHGKADRIQFDDFEIKELRKYFNSLDNDGSGRIEVDELEDPLIALGLVQSREEVEKLVKIVDTDQSGQIEFGEFLKIMSNIETDDQSMDKSPIYTFFKKMIKGDLMEEMDSNLPFKLNVSQYRRKKILGIIHFINIRCNNE